MHTGSAKLHMGCAKLCWCHQRQFKNGSFDWKDFPIIYHNVNKMAKHFIVFTNFSPFQETNLLFHLYPKLQIVLLIFQRCLINTCCYFTSRIEFYKKVISWVLLEYKISWKAS